MQRVNSLLSAGVTLTSTGTAVASPIPRDSSGYFPEFVRVVATGAGCYVKPGNVGVTAVAGDCMIQPLDGEILCVAGCKAISALTVSGTSSITVVPLERGSWSYDLRTLDYTFTSLTSLPSNITFARADATTCATYFNSSGVLSTAAANVARLDYDPATLLPRGLLIEESRVNTFLNSDLAGTNLATQSITVTAAPWTVSFTGTGTITFSGAFTGSLVGTGASTRVSSTFTPTAGSLTCTVTGTVKWAQAELGGFATSFIVSGASPTTRAAESASMTGANFSSWYNASTGTFVLEAQYIGTGSGGVTRIIQVDGGSEAERFVMADTGTQLRVIDTVASVSQADFSVGTSTTIRKSAFAYQLNDINSASNGTLGAGDTSCTMPTVNTLRFGTLSTGVTGAIWIRRASYYPTRLPNATLVSLTS